LVAHRGNKATGSRSMGVLGLVHAMAGLLGLACLGLGLASLDSPGRSSNIGDPGSSRPMAPLYIHIVKKA